MPHPPAESRLAILGGPLLETDCGFFDLIERAGGRVVLDATEGGQRTLPRPFDPARVAAEPLQELADAYFDGIPDAFRRPDTRLYEWLGRELAARQSGASSSAPLRLVRPLARRIAAPETVEPGCRCSKSTSAPDDTRPRQPHAGANRGVCGNAAMNDQPRRITLAEWDQRYAELRAAGLSRARLRRTAAAGTWPTATCGC